MGENNNQPTPPQSMPAQQPSPLLLTDRPPVSEAALPQGAVALQQFSFSAAEWVWAVQENYPAHAVQPRQGGTGVAYVPNNVPFEGTSAYSVRTADPAVSLTVSTSYWLVCQACARTVLKHSGPGGLHHLIPVQLHCEDSEA